MVCLDFSKTFNRVNHNFSAWKKSFFGTPHNKLSLKSSEFKAIFTLNSCEYIMLFICIRNRQWNKRKLFKCFFPSLRLNLKLIAVYGHQLIEWSSLISIKCSSNFYRKNAPDRKNEFFITTIVTQRVTFYRIIQCPGDINIFSFLVKVCYYRAILTFADGCHV